MNYRCPNCSRGLRLRSLFFHDISTCAHCGEKVVLGDVLAFGMAAFSMLVSALTALYLLNEALQQYFVAAGYALSIGMVAGLLVLLLLGRATPYRRRRRRELPPGPAAKA